MFADILLEDNAELKVKLREKAMPVKEYHQVRLPHGHSKYSVRKAHLLQIHFIVVNAFLCSFHFNAQLFLQSAAVHVQLHLPPTLVKKHIIQYPTVVHV